MASTAKSPNPMTCALAAVLLLESRAHGCHMQNADCFWDPHERGEYHSVCSVRACVQGALMRRGRAAGVRATPWVPGGSAWHHGWAETVGRPAWDGSQLGGVRARGRVSGRVSMCLPTVRSRACVDRAV